MISLVEFIILVIPRLLAKNKILFTIQIVAIVLAVLYLVYY